MILLDKDREILEGHAISPGIIERCQAHSSPEGIALLWAGAGQMVQVGRIADHLRVAGGQKYSWPGGVTTFPAMIRETGSPFLLIVEGTMQHLAAASWAPAGVDVWGIWGCDGIHGKFPLPRLDGRDVWLCLDADRRTNPRVEGAVARVTGLLRAAGAPSIRLVSLPATAGEHTGLDDYLARLPDQERTGEITALMTGATLTDSSNPAELAALYAPVDWETAWKEQPEDISWLCREPMPLETGTINALFAWQGTGKSLLAQELAWLLARSGCPVVAVDEENRVTDWVERLKDFGAGLPDLVNLKLYSFAGLPSLDTPAGGQHLLALADAGRARLVILDTTMRMVQGEENRSDTFLSLYRYSLVPLKARGITVLRLDHPGKDADRGQRGTSAKGDAEDTVWKMTEVIAERMYRLDRTKSRNGHGVPYLVLERQASPLRHHVSHTDLSPITELAKHLNDLNVPIGAGRDLSRAALVKAGVKARNSLLSAAIKYRQHLSGTGGDSGDRSGAEQGPPPVPTTPTGGGDRGTAPVPDSYPQNPWPSYAELDARRPQ